MKINILFTFFRHHIIEDPFQNKLYQGWDIPLLFGLVSCHTYVTVMLFQGLFKEDSEWI